jgi:colanic acid/amylovoran biosynthesis protein
MRYEGGQFIPVINEELCTNCNLCIETCPGIDIESPVYENEKDLEDKITGKHIESYSVYSKNEHIWNISTSGGVVTELIVNLLKNNEFEGAFVLKFDTFDYKPARLTLETEETEILKASKSKYIPASVFNIIETLKNEDSPNYIIVGTSCQIKGIKKVVNKYNINDENLLFIGLFCEKTLNFNTIKYIGNKYTHQNENLTKFDFKNKEDSGWPGKPKLYFDTGRELIIDRSERTKIKPYFQLESCLYCLDKLNRESDISVGDCYITGKEEPGRSSVIIRTEKGKRVFDSYSHKFHLEKSSIDSIKKSQRISEKVKNLKYGCILKNSDDYFTDFSDKESRDISLSYKKIQIGAGKNLDEMKIKTGLTIADMSSKMTRTLSIFKVGLNIGSFWLKDTISKNKINNADTKNNVIIVGGELFNKGAQAMTFTVVDQIQKRDPDKNIYLFSTQDFERDEIEKEKYKFGIFPFDIRIKTNILNSLFGFIPSIHFDHLDEIENIIKDTSYIIDINGYALFSKPHTKFDFSCVDYLANIMVAKKHSVPFYIFPQSIGPFNYTLKEKLILYPLMKRYLKYPVTIMPRENDGVDCLIPFTKKNVQKMDDIVLVNGGYNLNNIFKNKFERNDITILPNSAGIIPNQRVLDRMDREVFYETYKLLISELLRSGKNVYVLRHSVEDLSICQKIKSMFNNDENVRVISDDLDAINLENIIKQFDFIIASRYHSIVHAYKNGVPALVIGWAIKYYELMKDFDQLDCFYDLNNVDKTQILKSCKYLVNYHKKERCVIDSILKQKEKNGVFHSYFEHD